MFASILKDCPDYRALTAQERVLSEMIEDLYMGSENWVYI